MAHRFRDSKFPLRHREGFLACKPSSPPTQKIIEAMKIAFSFLLNSALQAYETGTRFHVRLTNAWTVGVFRKETSACVKFLKVKNASVPASKAQSLQVPQNPGSTENRKLRSTGCSPNTRGLSAKKARLRTTGDRAVPTLDRREGMFTLQRSRTCRVEMDWSRIFAGNTCVPGKDAFWQHSRIGGCSVDVGALNHRSPFVIMEKISCQSFAGSWNTA